MLLEVRSRTDTLDVFLKGTDASDRKARMQRPERVAESTEVVFCVAAKSDCQWSSTILANRLDSFDPSCVKHLACAASRTQPVDGLGEWQPCRRWHTRAGPKDAKR